MTSIENKYILDFIENGLYEDTHGVDHTSSATIAPDDKSKAILKVKDYGIIAGVDLAEMIFKYVDPQCIFEKKIKDGSTIKFGDIAFEVIANTQSILKAERLCLNIMQRMSGIASLSNNFAQEVADLPVKILDTRKTTPLIRFFEKWAVRIGGCYNYRDGLYDWIMIKDNHIDASGSITNAIQNTKTYLQVNNLSLNITIEVRNLKELDEVLKVGGITRIMLDNFEINETFEAVKMIDQQFESEASGGIKLNTIRKIAETGVNYISVGTLTHSAIALDLSLKIQKNT